MRAVGHVLVSLVYTRRQRRAHLNHTVAGRARVQTPAFELKLSAIRRTSPGRLLCAFRTRSMPRVLWLTKAHIESTKTIILIQRTWRLFMLYCRVQLTASANIQRVYRGHHVRKTHVKLARKTATFESPNSIMTTITLATPRFSSRHSRSTSISKRMCFDLDTRTARNTVINSKKGAGNKGKSKGKHGRSH